MSRLNLIYARARNGAIGHNNALPWHLPQDLAHFKSLTLGCPVIMGRKTWESLPERFRPLPGRPNWVISRNPQWQAKGAQSSTDLHSVLAACAHHPEVWVVGGAQLYALALPLAQRVVVTEIDADFPGDAFAPELDSAWTQTARESHTSPEGLPFSFVTYERPR